MSKIFAILAFFTLLNISCSKQRLFGKVACEGYIFDSIGGKGASGITVTLEACNPNDGRNFCATFNIGSTTTDVSGYYKIEDKSARSGRYFISAQGIKYQELNGSDLKNSNYTTGYLKK